MQYLKTFWKKVVSRIPDLDKHIEPEKQLKQARLDLLDRYKQNLSMDLADIRLSQVKVRQIQEKVMLALLVQIKQGIKYEVQFEYEQFNMRLSVQIERIAVMEQRLKQQEQLIDKEIGTILIEITQKSHIKGWLSNSLPEEWRGELEALRYHWLQKGKPKLWIKIMTGFHLLCMLKAHLQIQVENRWLPRKKQS